MGCRVPRLASKRSAVRLSPTGTAIVGSTARSTSMRCCKQCRRCAWGDFSVRLPGDQTGLSGKIADTFNEIVAANERMANQLARVGQVVGREGKTGNASGLRCSMVPGAKWRVRSIR